MHNSPPPDRAAAGRVDVLVLRPWRTFARAHKLPRPASQGPQTPPRGLLSALVTPTIISHWMGSQDAAMMVAPRTPMHVKESLKGKLDPTQPLSVDLVAVSTFRVEAQCTQGRTVVGRVVWDCG